MPGPSTKQTTDNARVVEPVVTRSGRVSNPVNPLNPNSFAKLGGRENSAHSAGVKNKASMQVEAAEVKANAAAKPAVAKAAAEANAAAKAEAAAKANAAAKAEAAAKANAAAKADAAANAAAAAKTEAAATASTVQFLRPGKKVHQLSDCIKYGNSSFEARKMLFANGPVEVAIADCTEGAFFGVECVAKANKKGNRLQVNQEYFVLTFIWRRNRNISIQFPMSYGSIGDYYVLVSEYAGVDLCEIWQKKGAFSINAILLMLYEAIEILAQLMELGVRHGDIKAQNLTSDENKCLKIIDFGNAEIKPKAHTASGSPPYMARATHKGNTDHPSDDVEGILWTAAALMVPSGAKLPWFDQEKHTKLLSEKEAFVTNLSKNILPANMAGLKEHVAVFRDLFAAYDKLQTSPDREAYQNMREIIANAWEKFKLVPKIEEAKLGDLL